MVGINGVYKKSYESYHIASRAGAAAQGAERYHSMLTTRRGRHQPAAARLEND